MKNIWESKTFWLNIVTTLLLSFELTQVVDILSTDQLKILGILTGVLNIILRVYLTDTKIKQGQGTPY